MGVLGGCPKYNVYVSQQEGIAELRKAEYSKQVRIQEALADKESASYKAEGEVIRAEGVAKANKIIGSSLRENEEYLRYLFINSLNDGKGDREIIYIPTEAGLPILEAGRSLAPLPKPLEPQND